ncbi:condensation domain-containing protein, partial [Pseudomonas aeruginosa]
MPVQELLKSVRSLSQKERKALAALLKRQGVNLYGITPVLKRSPEEPLQLSYAQQRQWFLWQLEPGSAAYHIPAVLRLHGELDTEALKRSFAALVERHEVLRTTFRQEGDETLQVVHDDLPLELREETMSGTDESALLLRIEDEVL